MHLPKELREIGYWTLCDLGYHLSEIGRFLVDSLKFLLREKEVEAGDFLEKLRPMELHIENLLLYRKEAKLFLDEYMNMVNEIKRDYKILQTPLKQDDKIKFRIILVGLLERVYSLIATGLKSLPNPSGFIVPSNPFSQKLKVKIGVYEWTLKETFIIGRTDDGYIGIRRFPYAMSLEELENAAESNEQLRKNFPVIYKSKEKLEEKPYSLSASRIHIVIYYDGFYFRMIDVSKSETIIEIDEHRFKSIGRRAKLNLPLLLIPLGEKNKLWIDPQLGISGPPVEITVLS